MILKKLFTITVLFAAVFNNLSSTNSNMPVSAADASRPKTISRTDAFGNVVFDGSHRYIYSQGTSERFYRTELNDQNQVIDRTPLAEDPFRGQIEIPAGASGDGPSPAELPATGLSIKEEWRYSLYGSSIGSSGLFIADIDNDGVKEVVAGANTAGGFGSDDYWYVLRPSGPNAYAQAWVSNQYSTPISQIFVVDGNDDGIVEIYIAQTNGQIHVYRGTDFAETNSFSTGYGIASLVIADADGNGFKDILLSDGYQIAAYSPFDNQLLWTNSLTGGDLAVGNVDTDPDAEIVVSTGYVLNGTTRAVEWKYPASGGFGSRVETGDVDGDGIAEIVGAASWYKITVFEADLQSPMWEISTGLDIAALMLADANGDGRPEILYGDGQWGSVHCINGQTHTEIWKIGNPEHGVTNIAVGDTDGDSALEVLWGAGATSTGPDYLYVADIATAKIEWQNADIDGPLSAVDLGDVDDDGQDEIVMASYSSESGYEDGVISIFNAKTHALEWQALDVPNISIWCGINSVRIGDVDDDGQTEFVIATGHLYDGLIQVYNGRTHTLERQSAGFSGTVFTAMEIGDVDGDTQTEIVVGQLREHTGATGVHLIVFNGATAAEEWESIGLDTYWGSVYDIELADVDGDSRIEMLASLGGSYVYAFDGVTHAMEAMIPTPAYALSSGDLDGDGVQSILVGRNDGKIEFYNGKTHVLESTLPLTNGPISCLSQADLAQNGVSEWLVCSGQQLEVYSIDSGDLLWSSGNLGSALGKYNQAPIGDIDRDNHLEIVAGAMNALYQFNVNWEGPFGRSHMNVSQATAQPGDTLTFTIGIVNQSADAFPDAQLDNLLPSGMNYIPDSLTASGGSAAYDNGTITWAGAVEAERTVTLSYQVSLDQHIPRMTHVNSAGLTAGGYRKTVSASVTVPPLYTFLPLCLKGCMNYQDNFQDPSSGWPVVDNTNMRTAYVNGEYSLVGKQAGYIYLIKAPTCQRQNYTVEADARWANLPGNGYGMVFGLTDDFVQYYIFIVNTDYRDFGLFYHDASGYQAIAPYTTSSAIRSGYTSNHLKVNRSGSQIVLEVNGTVLGTWNHTGPSGTSSVGLFNSLYGDQAYSDARFDNFSVNLLSSTTSNLPETTKSTARSEPGSNPRQMVEPFPYQDTQHGD